jgi:hypothetical protein
VGKKIKVEQSPEAAAADMRVCEFELRGIGVWLRGNLESKVKKS